MLNGHNTFRKYIFAEETSVRVGLVPLYGWRPRATYPETIPHDCISGLKVHVWGVISWTVPSEFAVKIIFFIDSTC